MGSRVLIVEDRESERSGLESLLRNRGYDVTAAPDGAKALEILADERPDLILLDMLMPDYDGWRFLIARRKDAALQIIPVLVVTGLDIATEAWAQSVGAAGLIKKPVNVDDLLEKVQRFARTESAG